MRVIGLTGGVGTGKTTVSRMLQELGAVLVDADAVGHQSYLPGTPAWKDLIAAFGEGILLPTQEIDRRKLGGIVFSDPAKLTQLNSIVHPRMRDIIHKQLEELRRQGVKVAVLEAAVLFEAKWEGLATEVWVTDAPEETVVPRLRARSGWTEEQSRARIAAQLPRAERLRRAQVVINTDVPWEEVKRQVKARWQEHLGPVE